MSKEFEFPEFYSFPPFFTIQPVLETREKQLALWRQLILEYHAQQGQPILLVKDCPLWKNPEIQRELAPEDVQVVLKSLVEDGSAEWMNDQQQCRILWKKPPQLAAELYTWAQSSGHIGGILTVYEILNGEGDGEDETLQNMLAGIDEDVLRRGLKILEGQGKCTIFQGETSNEDGVKFH
mmetsp:Transcript_122071/g.352801  ORF Transcript_122071/g.352801 Transcript_122071/m.352801 type:complete len:180 (-) Transcript_122071:954-1493(-)